MSQTIKDVVTWLKQWFYTETEIDTLLNAKQDTLVSGSSIKTINNQSVLGSGNISVGGGGGGGTIRLVDGYGIIWSVNTETGVSMITYNNTQTINANSYNTVKNPYTTGDTKINYCPNTSIYTPTSIQNVYIAITYMGEIRIYNRSSTKQSSVNVQGGISFVGKEYRG